MSCLKIDTDECQSIPAGPIHICLIKFQPSPNIAYMSAQTFIENVRNSGRQPRFVFSHSGGGGWRGWRGRAAVSVFVALEIAAPVLGGEAEPLQHGGRGPGLVQQHHLHCSAPITCVLSPGLSWSQQCSVLPIDLSAAAARILLLLFEKFINFRVKTATTVRCFCYQADILQYPQHLQLGSPARRGQSPHFMLSSNTGWASQGVEEVSVTWLVLVLGCRGWGVECGGRVQPPWGLVTYWHHRPVSGPGSTLPVVSSSRHIATRTRDTGTLPTRDTWHVTSSHVAVVPSG